MKPSGTRVLDGPPPLPKEASRKASNWMTQPKDSTSLGAEASNPLLQSIQALATIEQAAQTFAAANPAAAPQVAGLLSAFRQLGAQTLAANVPPNPGAQPQAAPGGPPTGGPGGMNPMPMPPMGGAGVPAGQNGM